MQINPPLEVSDNIVFCDDDGKDCDHRDETKCGIFEGHLIMHRVILKHGEVTRHFKLPECSEACSKSSFMIVG